jgi:hypothetical protein
MMQKRRSNVGQKGRRRPGGQPNSVIPHPPPITNIAISHDTKLRFVSTANVTLAITYQNLLDTILVAVTAVLGYQLFDLVKIRRIQAWSQVSSGVNTVSLHFVGRSDGLIGDDKAHSSSSMGIQPAYLNAKPDPKSQAGQFQKASSAVAFNFYCPAGTIVDLSLSYRSAMEGNAPTAAQYALIAATIGNVYYRGMDGLQTASTKFTPLGTPQIA